MGFDKRALRWGTQTLATRACSAALKVTPNVVFLGDGAGLSIPRGVVIRADEHRLGPGAALRGHLRDVRGKVLVFAADMPFVTERTLVALWDASRSLEGSVVAVDATGQRQPTLAVYRGDPSASLAADTCPSLFALLGDATPWPLPDGEEHAIDNVNTPAEWDAACAKARALGTLHDAQG